MKFPDKQRNLSMEGLKKELAKLHKENPLLSKEQRRLMEEDLRSQQESKSYEERVSYYKRLVSEGIPRKLGGSLTRQLQWLASFLNKEFSSLKAIEKGRLRDELAFLAYHGMGKFPKTPPIHVETLDRYFSNNLRDLTLLPQEATIEDIHTEFRGKVYSFFTRTAIHFSLQEASTLSIYRNSDGTTSFYIPSKSGEERLKWWLAFLLMEKGSTLHGCQQCGAIFIAKRSTRQFCRDQCRALSNMRKQRGTLPERYGKPGRPKKSDGLPKGTAK